VEVFWVEATVRNVMIDHEGGSSGSSGSDQLLVTVRVTNHSEDRKVDYAGWGSRHGRARDSLLRASLTDELGNSYRAVHFGAGSSVRGQRFEESIYPGADLEDVLIFERPVARARELRLELPGEAVGVTGGFRLVRPGPAAPASAGESP
jgi:hypothetical protein